jgi:protein-disulfide isomerase
MRIRGFTIIVLALAAPLFSAPLLLAQETPRLGVQQPSSIQQQIDELKAGQERMFRELAEIKRLLQEKTIETNPAARPAVSNVISVNVHGELFRGSGKARVGIIEYSDFDCSFCGRYVREIYPQIDRDYIQPGRIKYFFRDLPAPGETNAMLKARAARCAGEQGKFWELHDRLFATQSEPSGADMPSHAKALGLDVENFNACLISSRYADNIRLSIAGAKRIGIFGTPAFLIGTVSEDGNFMKVSKLLVGGESLDPIKKALDELLADSKK